MRAELGIGIFIDPICASFGFPLQAGDTCRAPAVQTVFNGGAVCLGPVYGPGGHRGLVNYAQPVCIEDALVQDNTTLIDLRVGDRFSDSSGRLFEITTGTPHCTFNCEMGHDINCDGVLGDYCAVEYDRESVGGVGRCLAERAAPSVPAITPASSPISAPTTLALTGPQDTLPVAALALLVVGGLAVVAARRRTAGACAEW